MTTYPDSAANRPGLRQGGSSVSELLLSLFGGEVLTAFNVATVMRDKHMVKSLEKGKEFRFPAIWEASTQYHTPGTIITGGSIPHTDIAVSPDDKLISDVFVADIDEIMNHYELRGPYAAALGNALARFYDSNVVRRVVQSARGGALFTGDQGGSTITNASFLTDAQALFDGLSTAKQTMDEKNVPVNDVPLYGLVKPAQWYLMARSDRNLNRFFTDGSATLQRQSLHTVDEIVILKSNTTPFGVNDAANSAIPAKYRADFTNTAGIVWTPMAAATAEVQGVSTQVVDQPEKQGTLLIARQMVGTDPLRTKCAVELATS